MSLVEMAIGLIEMKTSKNCKNKFAKGLTAELSPV